MRKENLAVFCIFACLSLPAISSSGEQLAVTTYQHLVSHESLLDGAIRSGDQRDFDRFIMRPTMALQDRWPKLGNPEYDKFFRCYFALDEFRLYSEDQFRAKGKLPKGSSQAKSYFAQKSLCKQALKGKV